jgi:hypothetical protein
MIAFGEAAGGILKTGKYSLETCARVMINSQRIHLKRPKKQPRRWDHPIALNSYARHFLRATTGYIALDRPLDVSVDALDGS